MQAALNLRHYWTVDNGRYVRTEPMGSEDRCRLDLDLDLGRDESAHREQRSGGSVITEILHPGSRHSRAVGHICQEDRNLHDVGALRARGKQKLIDFTKCLASLFAGIVTTDYPTI